MTRDDESAADPTWDAGGDRILYDAWPPRATSRDVYSRPAAALGNRPARRVTKRADWDLQPTVDATTSWIAWQCVVEGYEICIQQPQGKPIVLTSNSTDDEDPDW